MKQTQKVDNTDYLYVASESSDAQLLFHRLL
jgi:hypothetical protein